VSPASTPSGFEQLPLVSVAEAGETLVAPFPFCGPCEAGASSVHSAPDCRSPPPWIEAIIDPFFPDLLFPDLSFNDRLFDDALFNDPPLGCVAVVPVAPETLIGRFRPGLMLVTLGCTVRDLCCPSRPAI